MAGIEIIDLIEEPSAAAMYYLYDLYQKKKYKDFMAKNYRSLLVFDFGGGTLDLSLVTLEIDHEGNLKPKAVHKGGDMKLGGNNIDRTFAAFLIKYLDDKHGDDFIESVRDEFDYYRQHLKFRDGIDVSIKQFIMRLKEDAEKAKIELSDKDYVNIDFHRQGYQRLKLDKQRFEDWVVFTPEVKGRIVAAMRLIAEHDMPIDQLIMVGGSSQIPSVQKIIETEFPALKGRIVQTEDYGNAVVKGTAIIGAILSGIEIPPFGKNRCYNCVSHDIYIRNGNDKHLLIQEGTPYPFEEDPKIKIPINRALCTNIDLSIIEKFPVYDPTEEKQIPEYREIEQMKFYHPFFYRGESLAVELHVDEVGRLTYQVQHERTKEAIEYESERKFAFSREVLEEKKQWVESVAEA